MAVTIARKPTEHTPALTCPERGVDHPQPSEKPELPNQFSDSLLRSSDNGKHNFRHVSISNEEFHPLVAYEIIADPDKTKFQLGLMNGYLTLPFKKGTYFWVSAYYYRGGGRKPTYPRHKGTDFETPERTEILASAPGMVTQADYDSMPGNFITVDHGNDRSTSYCHLSQFLVHNGQKVKRGELIELSGNTGNADTPHLHFQLNTEATLYQPTIDPFDDKISAWTKENDPKYPII